MIICHLVHVTNDCSRSWLGAKFAHYYYNEIKSIGASRRNLRMGHFQRGIQSNC